MSVSLRLVLALACLIAGCSSSRRFVPDVHNRNGLDRAFAQFDSTATTAHVSLAFRSENLRGRVKGEITRASSEAYRIELIGQGKLFLKAYVTRSMTIVWPEGASPLVIEDEENEMLSDIISGLPEWPLRSCLPLLFPPTSDPGDSLQQQEIPGSAEIFLLGAHEGNPLVARFSSRGSSLNFPYKKIVIEELGQQSRLVWKIRP